MYINGTNYLLLERRGCEFFRGDTISQRSDVGNYRVYVEFTDKEGRKVCGDMMRANIYDHSKKSCPLIYDAGLAADFQVSHYVYSPSTDARRYDYTKNDILRFINGIANEQFEEIKWVQRFEAKVNKGANFTPSTLIYEFAKQNHLETTNVYGEMIVKMYTGNYKYLCYDIDESSGSYDKITVTLEMA